MLARPLAPGAGQTWAQASGGPVPAHSTRRKFASPGRAAPTGPVTNHRPQPGMFDPVRCDLFYPTPGNYVLIAHAGPRSGGTSGSASRTCGDVSRARKLLHHGARNGKRKLAVFQDPTGGTQEVERDLQKVTTSPSTVPAALLVPTPPTSPAPSVRARRGKAWLTGYSRPAAAGRGRLRLRRAGAHM